MAKQFVIVLKREDGFFAELQKKLAEKNITSAFLYGVGGFLRAKLAIFDSDKKEYISKTFEGTQLEVLNISGDVSQGPTGEVIIHCHTTLAGSDYRAIGGHLVSAVVGATCEITVEPLDHQLIRVFDERAGINIIKL